MVEPLWTGENPYYLIIISNGPEDIHHVDLDEPGWIETLGPLMRAPGFWYLVRKADAARPLVLVVHPGEQPYYTARHFGVVGSGGSNEITVYGIGKKKVDGSMVRLWTFLDGPICGGDDIDDLAIAAIKAMGPRQEAE